MSCPGYQPAYGTGQIDGTTYGGRNCTCWSGARAADDHSCGKFHPSSSQVRTWTGDTVGGTTLAQVDLALRSHLEIDLDTRYRYPWAEFIRRVQGGASAILQGWYAPIRDSRFSGSETFSGNHAMLVTPGLITMDPLADGRRAGIYKYHGEAYPEALLRTFAGRLNVGDPSENYVPLGDGKCYASFTRDNEPDYKVSIRSGKYGVYSVTSNVITGSRVATTGGFSATCSGARLYRWPGHTSQSLVRITSGSHSGQYVRSTWAKGI